jgi:hypothetical protein
VRADLSLMLSLWLLYSQRLALRRAQSQADEFCRLISLIYSQRLAMSAEPGG